MSKNNSIVKTSETKETLTKPQESTLLIDVASEMSKGYDLIQDIIMKLMEDYSVEEIEDENGNVIGKRTHIHPQLINWVREARMTRQDLWKVSGGEIQQEAEKKKLEIKAKLILQAVGKSSKDLINEAMKEWKQSRSFKE